MLTLADDDPDGAVDARFDGAAANQVMLFTNNNYPDPNLNPNPNPNPNPSPSPSPSPNPNPSPSPSPDQCGSKTVHVGP